MDEGIIKFKCNWSRSSIISSDQIAGINTWRDRMYKLGLIGVYSNGVGYGNISIRTSTNSFIITGTGTGRHRYLNENHYTLVEKYDIKKNNVSCSGPIKASSESLTHAMIYEVSQKSNAIIHIHNPAIWNHYIHKAPTTRSEVQYGTSDMAYEIVRLFKETDIKSLKKLIMGGHQDGIIAFGNSLDEAGNNILSMLDHK